jgi:GDP-L-fucose synthase
MVGSAIWRELARCGFANLLGRTRGELDLLDFSAVRTFYEEQRPEYVFVAAAKVGGILANDKLPVDFLYQNLQIQNNVIGAAHDTGVRKLLLPWKFLRLPQVGAATNERGTLAHWPPGTYE